MVKDCSAVTVTISLSKATDTGFADCVDKDWIAHSLRLLCDKNIA